jgi:hypothetical protein
MKMMGSSNHPCLNAKAKESHGLLQFASELLDMYDYSFLPEESQLQHKMLRIAAKYALDFDNLVQTTPRRISVETQTAMTTLFLTHCSYLVRSGSDRTRVIGVCTYADMCGCFQPRQRRSGSSSSASNSCKKQQQKQQLHAAAAAAEQSCHSCYAYMQTPMPKELRPKHHIMFHCLQRATFLGGPRHYHTYRDESLNGLQGRAFQR